ncbi:MAG: hypothetical protein JXR84_15200 [Anaerolineae bacterium]|nr:hypothetical protein [Anaerolineae bacterium]
MTSLQNFITLAVRMREAQKHAEATQLRSALYAAQKLEQRFDRILLEVMGRYVSGMDPLPGFVEMSDPSGDAE